MTPPRLYEDWCIVFEAFKSTENDEIVYRVVLDGRYPDSHGVVERTTQRLLEVYNIRLQALQRALQNELNRSRSEIEIERALGNLVSGLRPLARVALVPTFPEAIRQHLRDSLDSTAKRIRESLEDSARRSGSIDGILLSSIKRVVVEVPWASAATRTPRQQLNEEHIARAPRRVIL